MKLKRFLMIAAAVIALVVSTGTTTAFAQNKTSKEKTMGKSLVVYFSLAGDQYNVGGITEGNTAIVAKMIAAETGADLFEIEPTRAYTTTSYNTLIGEAKDEQQKKARPALKADTDISAYDTIFIGYPIWWGDMPMVVYTFLEAHDWSGKTVVPFCTHEGSGSAGTDGKIKRVCKGATVKSPLAVQGKTAQTNRAAAKKAVQEWMKKIGR